jgi:hypothetical protein
VLGKKDAGLARNLLARALVARQRGVSVSQGQRDRPNARVFREKA